MITYFEIKTTQAKQNTFIWGSRNGFVHGFATNYYSRVSISESREEKTQNLNAKMEITTITKCTYFAA